MPYNNVEYGFRVGNASKIDDRLVLSKEEMRLISDIRMPNKYFALCSDDQKLYVYDVSNERLMGSNDTGRFRVYASAEDAPVADIMMNLNNNEFESIVDNNVAKIDLPFTVKDGMICAVFDK